MLRNVSHLQGVENGEEILFDTPFGYIFEYLCHNPYCRLPTVSQTIDHLIELGNFMADVDPVPEPDQQDSDIPAVYTYLGQFIDHDITARTDREEQFKIADPDGNKKYFDPIEPDEVVASLKNGRRPNLDLDSVFGDGPSFSDHYQTQADDLYDEDCKLKINRRANYIDLPRNAAAGGEAIIADHRNDENVMISQLHAAIIAFYNRTFDALNHLTTKQERHTRARQLTQWAYQYVIVNDYLNQVCDPDIVRETLQNGPYYYGQFVNTFMPLEFSIAGFRFGHSMIRPSYRIGGQVRTIDKLLGVSRAGTDLLDPAKGFELKKENVVHWADFVSTFPGSKPQRARKIDTKIARGLFQLDQMAPNMHPGRIIAVLTQRNLLRGYLLSLPTGQSVAKAMRIFPLTPEQIKQGNTQEENDFLISSGFIHNTPLWYYILKEAEVHQQGARLGVVGSKIVAETLIGLLKKDPNSYLFHHHDKAVVADGIKVKQRATPIRTIFDMLDYAKVPIIPPQV